MEKLAKEKAELQRRLRAIDREIGAPSSPTPSSASSMSWSLAGERDPMLGLRGLSQSSTPFPC
jgi:hypothetical protein